MQRGSCSGVNDQVDFGEIYLMSSDQHEIKSNRRVLGGGGRKSNMSRKYRTM
jgi:hypothetical protein